MQYIAFHHIADSRFAIPDAANTLVSEVLLYCCVSPTFPPADVSPVFKSASTCVFITHRDGNSAQSFLSVLQLPFVLS